MPHVTLPAPLPVPPSPQFLSKLVNLQGIVTRCTLVRPKIVKSVHWCPATGQFQSREYRDVTSNTGAPTTTAYPTKCVCLARGGEGSGPGPNCWHNRLCSRAGQGTPGCPARGVAQAAGATAGHR